MNIGVLGGTFDPIHVGHLILAEEARIKLGLNKVVFVPAGQPWLKVDRVITPQNHRLEMVRRAIATNPYFELCTLELERSGPSYTIDTITMLRKQLGGEASFFLMLGHDALADLPLWKEPRKLVQICRLVVAPRLSSNLLDLNSLELAVPGLLDNIIQLDMPVVQVSSSEIRKRLAQGLSIRYLVPDEVERYIIEQRIYLTADSHQVGKICDKRKRLQMLLQLLKTGLSKAKDKGMLKGKRWDWWTYYSPEDELRKLRRERRASEERKTKSAQHGND